MTLEATRLVAAAPNDKESEPGQAKEIGNGQEQADNRVVNTHRRIQSMQKTEGQKSRNDRARLRQNRRELSFVRRAREGASARTLQNTQG